MEPIIVHDPAGDRRPGLARWISSVHHQISPSPTTPVSPLSSSSLTNNSIRLIAALRSCLRTVPPWPGLGQEADYGDGNGNGAQADRQFNRIRTRSLVPGSRSFSDLPSLPFSLAPLSLARTPTHLPAPQLIHCLLPANALSNKVAQSTRRPITCGYESTRTGSTGIHESAQEALTQSGQLGTD